jgi:two-component system NtrC family sensor kinase
MSLTKMWRVFYVVIGFGLITGVALYLALYLGGGNLLMEPRIGLPIAGTVGLLLGLSYFLFFKLALRFFTRRFLNNAQALTKRPIAPLPPLWASDEIEKLGEILTDALDTLQRLDRFSTIAKEIVASLDPQRTLDNILDTTVETLPAHSGLVFLLDEESQQYKVQAFCQLPLPEEQVKDLSFTLIEGVPSWVATEGDPLVITDAQRDERLHPVLRQLGVQSLLSAPLVAGDRPVGVLNLFNHSQRSAFEENDVRLACTYADLAAVALDNARLFVESVTERSKLAAVLSDTTDAVVVLDQTDHMLLLNQAAEQCLEVQSAQIIGQPITALGMDELESALASARTAAAPVVRELVTPGERTLNASISPVHDVGWVMVMQDITPLKELDRLRTEWVAAVSHDLKNPITIIQMSAGLMEKIGPLSDAQREWLAKIQHGTERLRTLVTDVLDLARLEAGPALQASAVDVVEVVADALAEVEPLAVDKGHILTTDLAPGLPPIRGDAALLTRVLTDLLSNAIKYTPDGGQVTVSVRQQNGLLQVEVMDTGRGIPAEALPHLFDRFYQVPGSEDHAKGTGLGLNIVKTIIEKHGGKVWVESELGQGSRFAFTVATTEDSTRTDNPREPSIVGATPDMHPPETTAQIGSALSRESVVPG